MNISFQKKKGNRALGISFFWKMTVNARTLTVVSDCLIPELFFDYIFIRRGNIRCTDPASGTEFNLPQQTLKTLHTRPVTLLLSPPLVLFGARLSLQFAESFWLEMKANSFLEQDWARNDVSDLDTFRSRVEEYIESHGTKKVPYPMFSSGLEESGWLANFSPRQKRRYYKMIFGLGRRDLQNIQKVHVFLEQTCDFNLQNPHIIQHVNPEVFYDQPHLNHTFRRMTEFSPMEYFQANSILQDKLMSASYNEVSNL